MTHMRDQSNTGPQPLFRSRNSLCVAAAATAGSMLLPILVVHSHGGGAPPHSVVCSSASPSSDVSSSTELAPTVRGLLTTATSSQSQPPAPPPSARNVGRPSVLAAAVAKSTSGQGHGAAGGREASRPGVGVGGAELSLGLVFARASSFADARSGRSWRRPAAVHSGAVVSSLAIGRRGTSPERRRGDSGLRVDPSPLPLSARPRAGGALADENTSATRPQALYAQSSVSSGSASSRIADALDAVRRAQLLKDGDEDVENNTATNDSEERPQQRLQVKTQPAAEDVPPPPTPAGDRRPGSGRWARCRDGAPRELTLLRVILPAFGEVSSTGAAASELSACETRCASSALSAT